MKTMKKVDGSGSVQHQYFHRATETGEGIPVRVPNTGQPVLVVVSPAAGQTARIEYTISDPTHIAAGTALWLSWEEGEALVPTSSALSPGISGVRVVGTGGTTWEATA